MKFNKSCFFCIIAILCLLLCFCACNNSEEPVAEEAEETEETEEVIVIETEYEAIETIMNYGSGTPYDMIHRIGNGLNFNQFYEPRYGSAEAIKISDYWYVTIKGNMMGYVDEYASEMKTKNFTVSAFIYANGFISISVEEEAK